jgi:hypothetical protein
MNNHDNNALPDLPEPGHWYFDGGECLPTDGFTADQMRQYGERCCAPSVEMAKRWRGLYETSQALLDREMSRAAGREEAVDEPKAFFCPLDHGPGMLMHNDEMAEKMRAYFEPKGQQFIPLYERANAAPSVDGEMFICYLIDKCERETITEESLHEWLADFLKNPRYHRPTAPAGNGGEEYPEAAEVCAEAYQVVGCMLMQLGLFDTPEAEKILDNLSQHRMVHRDVLPWTIGPIPSEDELRTLAKKPD